MKKFILTLMTLSFVHLFVGQSLYNSINFDVFTNGTSNELNAVNVSGNEIVLAVGDSLLVETSVTAGTITPTTGENSSVDTLVIRNFLGRLYTIDNAASEYATLSVYNSFSSYDIVAESLGDAGTYNRTQEFTPSISGFEMKFVEGEKDTLVIVNNSTQDIFLRVFQLRYSISQVISNTPTDLLNQESVLTITNPIENDVLTLNFLSDMSLDVELISLEGQLLARKSVSQDDNTIDVAHLDAGTYILRELTTNSSRLLIIK